MQIYAIGIYKNYDIISICKKHMLICYIREVKRSVSLS